MPNRVEGYGSISAKLMIIGEAPGAEEDKQGKPFVGPTGRLLWEWLSELGIKESEVWITNVCKYRPPLNNFDQLHLIGIDLDKEIESLWQNEIRRIRPNCILAVGDEALKATTGLTGILTYRGSILRSRDGDLKVVPTIHPAALFNRGEKGGLEYTWSKLIKHDIARASAEADMPSLNLPARELTICRSSLDLYRYFDQYKSLSAASMDIESINCVPVCIGFAFNRHHAISIPLLRKIGKHELTSMFDSEFDEIYSLIDEKLRTLKLIGHNLKYDEFKLNLFGFSGLKVFSDTLIKTRVIFPELPDKRLSCVSSIWTREPYYKDEGKEFKLGKQDVEKLFLYNAKDCVVEFEVDEEQEKDLEELSERFKVPLKDYYYNYQMRKHSFYLEMENNGFRVDREKQKSLKKKYTEMQQGAHQTLVDLIGHEVNVKSYPQMFDLLYKEMRFRERKDAPTSEDSIIAILANNAKKPLQKKILETILEERRIRDQKSRNIEFNPDFDGRCRTSFNIISTETCRSSTGVLKKPLRPRKIGLAYHTISKHGKLGRDIRSMFIPDEGNIFLQADSSQAEARVVAVLSEDYELLRAFDCVDIHRRTAALIFGYTKTLDLRPIHLPSDDMDKDGPERFTGKMTRHAGNYDMGKHRHMTEFNTNAQKYEINMNISEWRAGENLKAFHSANPKIKSRFHRDIKDCLESCRTLIDPFGGVRVFNGRMDDELHKEGYANIPQRTVAHLVQGAALKVREEIEDCFFISENHDSLLMQAPENNWEPYARLLKKHMEAPIDFNTYCSLKRDIHLVIPCDIEVSNKSWADMKKVKL